MTDNVISLGRRRVRPLPIAYQQARMDEPCSNCQAPPGDWCQHPDGYTRKIPCVARLHNNNPKPDQLRPAQPKQQPLCSVYDFSEPFHREEA